MKTVLFGLVLVVLLACGLGAQNIYDNTTRCEAALEATTSNVLGFECSARIVKSGGSYDIFVKMAKTLSDDGFRVNAGGMIGMVAEMTKNSNWRSGYLYVLDGKRLWRIKTSDCRKALRITNTEGPIEGGLFILEKFQVVF